MRGFLVALLFGAVGCGNRTELTATLFVEISDGAVDTSTLDAFDTGPVPLQRDAMDGGTVDAAAEAHPASCVSDTCQERSYQCGTLVDECGQTQDCGTCRPPLFCGALAPHACGYDLPGGP